MSFILCNDIYIMSFSYLLYALMLVLLVYFFALLFVRLRILYILPQTQLVEVVM